VAKEARKAEESKAAKAKAEKQEDEKIRAANVAMKAGIVAHEANKTRAADEAAVLGSKHRPWRLAREIWRRPLTTHLCWYQRVWGLVEKKCGEFAKMLPGLPRNESLGRQKIR
jgi:hypothetical protein